MFAVEGACLVLVDVQGKLATIVDESESMIEHVAKLVHAMQALGILPTCTEMLLYELFTKGRP